MKGDANICFRTLPRSSLECDFFPFPIFPVKILSFFKNFLFLHFFPIDPEDESKGICFRTDSGKISNCVLYFVLTFFSFFVIFYFISFLQSFPFFVLFYFISFLQSLSFFIFSFLFNSLLFYCLVFYSLLCR